MMLADQLIFITLLVIVLVMLCRDEKSALRRILPFAKAEEYWDGKERRRHIRFRTLLDATYTIAKRPRLNNSRTVDISQGGVKLLLGEKMPKGTLINLRITLPGAQKSVDAVGEVAWSDDAGSQDQDGRRLFSAGVKFLAFKEPSSKNLAEFITTLGDDLRV